MLAPPLVESLTHVVNSARSEHVVPVLATFGIDFVGFVVHYKSFLWTPSSFKSKLRGESYSPFKFIRKLRVANNMCIRYERAFYWCVGVALVTNRPFSVESCFGIAYYSVFYTIFHIFDRNMCASI